MDGSTALMWSTCRTTFRVAPNRQFRRSGTQRRRWQPRGGVVAWLGVYVPTIPRRRSIGLADPAGERLPFAGVGLSEDPGLARCRIDEDQCSRVFVDVAQDDPAVVG